MDEGEKIIIPRKSRIKVFELAMEFGMSSKALTDILIELGYDINGHISLVDYETAQKIRDSILKGKSFYKKGDFKENLIKQKNVVINKKVDEPLSETFNKPLEKGDIITWSLKITELIKNGLKNTSPTSLGQALLLMEPRIPKEYHRKLTYLNEVRNRFAHDINYDPEPILKEYVAIAREVYDFLELDVFN